MTCNGHYCAWQRLNSLIQCQGSPIPTKCCLHHVIEADGGSHHIRGTADDLEGELVLGAALLVSALVPGQLPACEGGAGLQAMVLAPWGDTSCVPEGPSRAGAGAQCPIMLQHLDQLLA